MTREGRMATSGPGASGGRGDGPAVDRAGAATRASAQDSFAHSTSLVRAASFSAVRTSALTRLLNTPGGPEPLRDCICVIFANEGKLRLGSGAGDPLLLPGQFTLYDMDNLVPLEVVSEAPSSHTVFSFARAPILRAAPHIEALVCRPLRVDDPIFRVFTAIAREVEQLSQLPEAPDMAAFGATLSEALISSLLLCSGDGQAKHARQRTRIMKALTEVLRDADLSLEEFAKNEGIGVRSIQRAFQEIGLRPWSWVVEQRLLGASKDLGARAMRHVSVMDIALSWGFSDISNFNRAFKKQFGKSPTAFRKKG